MAAGTTSTASCTSLMNNSRKRNDYNVTNCGGVRSTSSTVETTTTTTIGFIGLGNMGFPMCQNLFQNIRKEEQHNHHPTRILAFDVNEQIRNSIVTSDHDLVDNHSDSTTTSTNTATATIQAANSIKEIAVSANCSIIFTMLPGCDAVNTVMKEIMHHRKNNSEESNSNNTTTTIFIDCSTVSPTTSRYWSNELSHHGHVFVDAPVSGGVKGAKNKTLTFMVGNADTTHDNASADDTTDTKIHVEKYLQCMGSKIIHCGGSGTGAATKLCNNLALACQMIGICEAMNLGEALSVDPILLANVMNTSTAKCWSSEINNPHPKVAAAAATPASNNYKGGFSTNLMLKDLSLAISSAAEASASKQQRTKKNSSVSLPMGTLSKELYQMAQNHGYGDSDFGVMLQFLKGNTTKEQDK